MTSDIVLMTRREPPAELLVEGLLAAGPDLRIGSLSDAAAFQLFDDDAQLMVTLEHPTLIRIPGEAERLLGVASPEVPYWWIELRAPTAREDARLAAARLAVRLAEELDGVIWTSS